MTELLTDKQVAEILQKSTGTLANIRSQGGGPPYIKIGKTVRYRKSDLEAFINGHVARTSTSQEVAA